MVVLRKETAVSQGPRRAFLIFAVLVAAMVWPVRSYAAQLTLTWADNSTTEDGFAIERATGTTGTFAEIAAVGPNVTSYTDPDLSSATTYCYRVRAFSVAGDSAYSNDACGTTSQTLAVIKSGSGGGTVTSSPAGITCGTSCAWSYPSGTVVTVTATPAADSAFAGWSGGGCTGTDACTVTLNVATTVTATFNQTVSPAVDQTFLLALSTAGSGSGTVTSTPAGITCGTSCSASYPSGTVVTLTAGPAAHSTFAGWRGGGCTGTGDCTVTLSAATAVTATFDLQTTNPQNISLTVNNDGSGNGKVTSWPAGINCGSTCTASYPSGTVVTLTASHVGNSSTFMGWSGGGCTGTDFCTVTMTDATTVIATFSKNRPVNRTVPQ